MSTTLEAAHLAHGVSRAEASQLIRATGVELDELFREAARVRTERTGQTITHSRKVFIPLTNLCRDRCGYCTFARAPGDSLAHTMTPEEVLAIAEAGQRAGCKEALFSLGEKPELRYPSHAEWLDSRGYESTVDYLAAMCRLVLDRTNLIPHVNPGTMNASDFRKLRSASASAGMMLETTSARLLRPGEAHHACPDKVPSARLATLRTAGEMRVPFTTGILIGIGETLDERIDALFAIRDLHDRYGHIQEVIVQNFRSKPDTPFAHHPEPDLLDLARTIAVARLIFGSDINVQAPPNLTIAGHEILVRAGINDWGGISPVTLDFINPERAWPKLTELRELTAKAGFELRERLPVYPEYLRESCEFLDPSLRGRLLMLTDESGFVRRSEERW